LGKTYASTPTTMANATITVRREPARSVAGMTGAED
jgi:hypothetical protein